MSQTWQLRQSLTAAILSDLRNFPVSDDRSHILFRKFPVSELNNVYSLSILQWVRSKSRKSLSLLVAQYFDSWIMQYSTVYIFKVSIRQAFKDRCLLVVPYTLHWFYILRIDKYIIAVPEGIYAVNYSQAQYEVLESYIMFDNRKTKCTETNTQRGWTAAFLSGYSPRPPFTFAA